MRACACVGACFYMRVSARVRVRVFVNDTPCMRTFLFRLSAEGSIRVRRGNLIEDSSVSCGGGDKRCRLLYEAHSTTDKLNYKQ